MSTLMLKHILTRLSNTLVKIFHNAQLNTIFPKFTQMCMFIVIPIENLAHLSLNDHNDKLNLEINRRNLILKIELP